MPDCAIGGGAFAKSPHVGAGLGQMPTQDFPTPLDGFNRVFIRWRGRGQVNGEMFGGVTLLQIGQHLHQGLHFGARLFDSLLVLLQFPLSAFGLQLPLQASTVDGVAVALGTAHIALLSDW
ncbi:MAG: hypothetical protein P9F19_18655 [Candidatus Contendobacter sp.]|nr:hypothetical protein [Candidatus Contendobacter sp.]MDG4559390.1 hypothetical protein [Candidatus Contendobacter sp.]